MEKLIKDGKVAVIYSRGFGAGWSTWCDNEFREILCMDKDIAEAVLNEDFKLAEELALKKCDADYLCTLGVNDLKIEWIDQGLSFEIDEYDGSESVHIIGSHDYMIA